MDLKIIQNDPWLEPYRSAIEGRHAYALQREKELTQYGVTTLSDFASGYLYFGLHKQPEGWVLREWAPNATDIFVVGDFNQWQRLESYKLKPIGNGVFEGFFPEKSKIMMN